jgi:hypothetical protein
MSYTETSLAQDVARIIAKRPAYPTGRQPGRRTVTICDPSVRGIDFDRAYALADETMRERRRKATKSAWVKLASVIVWSAVALSVLGPAGIFAGGIIAFSLLAAWAEAEKTTTRVYEWNKRHARRKRGR